MNDLAILNGPVLQLGYIKAINDVQAMNLPGFERGVWSDYNPGAVDQIDRLVAGYAHCRKLTDLVVDPSLPATSPEAEQEDQGEN